MVVGALAGFAQAVAPNRNWGWLKRRYSRMKMRAKLSRNKRVRVVPSVDLYALGIQLMETACDGKRREQPFFAASQHRDGLQIALLAARPLRIRNFQDIEQARTLIYRGRLYWLMFDEEETKTGRPIEVYVPEHLRPYLDGYLKNYRQALLAKLPTGSKPTRALWVSRSGEKMEEPAIRCNIERRTKAEFGHSINPHLFRDCLATSFATDDPEHVRCVSTILGHASLATAEKYYNQATSLTAAHAFSATMLQIRYAFIEILEDETTREFLAQMTKWADHPIVAGETDL
jgi:integrase